MREYVRLHACADGSSLCTGARPAFRVLIAPRAAVGDGDGGDMAAALLVVLGLVLLGVESGSGAGEDWEGRARAAGERGLGLRGPPAGAEGDTRRAPRAGVPGSGGTRCLEAPTGLPAEVVCGETLTQGTEVRQGRSLEVKS